MRLCHVNFSLELGHDVYVGLRDAPFERCDYGFPAMTVYDTPVHFLNQFLGGCHALAYLVYHALVTYGIRV